MSTLTAEVFIQEARKILKPEPVRIGHVPNWLRLHLIRQFSVPRHYSDGESVLRRVAYRREFGDGHWLDHWGSVKIDNKTIFVSEPYPNCGVVSDAESFAKAAQLMFGVSANSYWYPGSTIRLEFWLPDTYEGPNYTKSKPL